jgi:hypothetical protein
MDIIARYRIRITAHAIKTIRNSRCPNFSKRTVFAEELSLQVISFRLFMEAEKSGKISILGDRGHLSIDIGGLFL